MTATVASGVSPFLDALQRDAALPPSSLPAWAAGLRRQGCAELERLGLPSADQEAWRFTDLKQLRKLAFSAPARERGRVEVPPSRLLVPESSVHRCVFVDGRPLVDGAIPSGDGFTLRPLAEALSQGGVDLEPLLGRLAPAEEGFFTALNAAFLGDGVLVQVAPDRAPDRPIHLVFASLPGDPAPRVHPRVILLLGRGARAVVVEEYISLGEGPAFTNPVTEVDLGDDAALEHVRLLRENEQTFHLGGIAVRQGRDSRYTGHSISLGGRLVRQDIGAVLDGAGAECSLNGLYLVAGRQHVDHHTRIDHAAPHTTSRELYKGVLDGKASGVFNGLVLIREGVGKIDAAQTNNNLLLSGEALVNTNPELEIFADDVKAVHGATIGQIEEEELFYLRSRGIDSRTARHLLIQGFAGEVLERLGMAPLRERLTEYVRERF